MQFNVYTLGGSDRLPAELEMQRVTEYRPGFSAGHQSRLRIYFSRSIPTELTKLTNPTQPHPTQPKG